MSPLYNELLINGVKGSGSIIANPTVNGNVVERILQRFYIYNYSHDGDRGTKIYLSDITKRFDQVYIEESISGGGDKATNIINAYTNNILGYNLITSPITTNIAPTTSRIKLSDYIAQVSSWCQFDNETSANRKIVEWNPHNRKIRDEKIVIINFNTYHHIL